MKKITFAFVLSLFHVFSHAQDFKSDNVRYQTISWSNFFKRLELNPKLVYFDIRSDGERTDNGKLPAFNQGKIKGAIETDFGDFEKYYPEYQKYKNDTIYLYCSHSKRSRYLAKRLADSSFVNVVNINGGLSYFNSLSESEMPYRSKYYTSNLKYALVPPVVFTKALNNEKFQIIDIRPDSLYLGIAKAERENSFGKIKSALHIPYDKLQHNLKLLDKSKTILLFDNDGNQSPIAANYLIEQGYQTSVLVFGLQNIISSYISIERAFLETKYRMILPEELLKLSNQNSNTIIIDVRPETEFDGTDKVFYKNVGHLRNAINMPLATLNKEKIAKYAGKTIILYDRMMEEELFAFAKRCKEYGVKDLYLLTGGIFQLQEDIYDHQELELKSLLDQ